jgi:hypothetical protein
MSQTITLTQPKRDVQTVETRSGLPTHRQKPTPRFVYVVYPKSWEFDDTNGFLPVLCRLVAKPGCNGVNMRGSLAKPIASAQMKGGTFIDPKDTRLGPYTDYVQYYDCDNGGRWYVDFCAKATVLTSGEIIWNTKESAVEFDGFRKHLREAGIVPPMLPEIYNWLVRREEEKAKSYLSKAGNNPHMLAKYDAQIERIDAMQKAFDTMQGKKPKAKAGTPKRRTAENVVEG